MARTPKVVEDRREQIIEAALHVFSQKGFIRATNKDIAREAGITPGLIYYYFDSKEALLQAIIETKSPIRVLNTLPATILELPPDAFMRFMIRQVLDIVEGPDFPPLIRMLLPEIVHNPEMATIAAGFLQRVMGFLTGYLASKMESGILRRTDASLIAQILFGSMIGFVLRRQILRDPTALQYSHEQIADTIIETVLQGILPRS